MARPKAITSLADSAPQGKRNWMIYADSGVGKTVLAGTAPKALFLVTEAAGTESAKAFGSTADEWVCDTWTEFREAHEWIKAEGHKEYEWALVDSLSEMEELCWRDQLEEAHENNSNRSLFQPAIQDYQIVGNKMKRMVDAFNRLPINVLYTAQTMRLDVEDQETDDDTTLLLPLVGSQRNGVLAQKICGMTTLNGLLQVKRPKNKEEEPFRRLFLQGGKRFVAKDRHDTFGAYLDHPNIAEMATAVDARQARQDKGTTTAKKTTRRRKTSEEAA